MNSKLFDVMTGRMAMPQTLGKENLEESVSIPCEKNHNVNYFSTSPNTSLIHTFIHVFV